MTTHTVVAIVSGIVCGTGGFMVGRATRDWTNGLTRREIAGWIARLAIAALIIVLAVVTQIQRDEITGCYRQYFGQVSAALADRSDATGKASEAELAYLDTIRTDGDIPGARAVYIGALRQLDLERRAAPIPQPPECG